jgi:hypothetical protein
MDLGLASRDRPTYPGQRGLTQTMRDAATKSNDAIGTSLRSLRRNSLSVIGATADKYERLS